jgi:hypothetical protein
VFGSGGSTRPMSRPCLGPPSLVTAQSTLTGPTCQPLFTETPPVIRTVHSTNHGLPCVSLLFNSFSFSENDLNFKNS